MMLNMPPSLAEPDAARSPQPHATASEPGKEGDSAHSFARLMTAGEPADPTGTPATVIATGDDGSALAPEAALAEALVAAIESGKIVPPAGESLPPGHLIRGPAAVAGDPAATEDSPLMRMMDMLRTLQGLAGQPQPAGGTEMPMQPGLELKGFEPPDSVRLLATALGAQSQAPVSAAPASAATTPAAAATPPSVPIPVAPGRPDWGEAVGQRVLWMVSHKSQAAEIRLNPPELGPVEVKIRTDDDGVRLSFAAGNAAVREALESAAPRLREMFLAEGLRLENMDIGQRHAGGERGSEPGAAAMDDGAGADEADAAATAQAGRPQRVGLVDCFV